MRATRAAMLGPAGTAKLGLENDDVKTKMVIDADRVTKRYGERAIVKDFTLRIQRGDRIGVVGANGAGKNTLLKLMTGAIEPDAGRIRREKSTEERRGGKRGVSTGRARGTWGHKKKTNHK